MHPRSDGGRPLFLLIPPEGPLELADTLAAAPATTFAVHVLGVNPGLLSGVRTLNAIATRVVSLLREAQPSGPLRIAGWGSAGALAFEVARQLLGADEDIDFLALIDADLPSWAERRARLVEANIDTTLAPWQRAVLEGELRPLPLHVHAFGSTRGWNALVRADRFHRVELTTPGTPASRLADALARSLVTTPPRLPVAPPSLITIQRGERGMAPVFCLPGAGAGVADFVHLVGAWGSKVPAHGVHHRGLDGVHVPYSTVEAAAEAQLREVCRVAPSGDVHLVGHSFGGWLAFELAVRLEASGRRASLTLLDSSCPGGSGRVGQEYTRPETLVEMATLFELTVGRPLDLTLADFETRDVEQQLALVHSRLVRAGLLPNRTEPSVLRGPVDAFEAALRTQYRPSATFGGTARLVLVPWVGETEEQSRTRFDEVVTGWSRLAPKLEHRRGSGNHVTMLKPPHVAGLADWTQSVLRAAPLAAHAMESSPGARPAHFGSPAV